MLKGCGWASSSLDPRFSVQYIGQKTSGVLEYWNVGILVKAKIFAPNVPLFHHSIPPVFLFPMIRYAGLFSNRWKRQYLAEARIALNQSESEDSDANTESSWAERQTEYTATDPLVCPNCDQPLTLVGAFFGNWNELQYFFDRAGKDSTIPPALLRPG